MDTILRIEDLAKQTRRCTLVWIKAHVGYEGNEEADACARAATLLPGNDNIPLPKNLIKKYWNKIYTNNGNLNGLQKRPADNSLILLTTT